MRTSGNFIADHGDFERCSSCEKNFELRQGVFLLSGSIGPKKAKTVLTIMVARVVWATNFTYEVRSEFRGFLEAIEVSKPRFLCCYLIDGSS